MRKFLTILLLISAAWIISATLFGVPRDWKLGGVEKPPKTPRLNAKSWFDGTFSKAAEKWLGQKFGVKGFAVRIGNQINHSIFRVQTKKTSDGVIFGGEGWLYQGEYIRFYENQFLCDSAALSNFVDDLEKLTALLDARGVPLVVVISPSKAEVVPEFLPPKIRRGVGGGARAQLKEAAAGRKIRLVDAAELLSRFGAQTFPQCGTHWNQFGAHLALNAALECAQIAHPEIVGAEKRPFSGADDDLRALANLLSFAFTKPPKSFYPILGEAPTFSEGAEAARKSALIVGDSFAFQLVDALARAKIVRDAELLYYSRRKIDFDLTPPDFISADSGQGTALSRGEIDWEKLFAERKIVIIELNEIFIRHSAWHFPLMAIEGLK